MNRLESLSTKARNQNRKAGVTFEPKASNGKWVVRAVVKGRLTSLGGFDTQKMAEEYYEQVKTNQQQ